ncbi:MAG: glycogen synthase [Verrucomicrobiae bacterium]|nr:glycogen synthase [Verrucomicrobiae bacterium]
MKVLQLTNEYPPNTYGGAGVHIAYLSRELARLTPVEVRCFGDQTVRTENLEVTGFGLDRGGFTCPKNLESVFGSARRCLDFNTLNIDADVVHCHTWYTHLGGIMARLNYGIPLVVTTHSLEPLRPWKREQLGGGYDFSLWVEKTALEMADAVIAVSEGAKQDILRHFNVREDRIHIIYNGIDPEEYRKVSTTTALEKYGINPAIPFLLFVGRITRQKGIVYLVRAIEHMHPDFQIVLCAGAPDTPEIAAEMKAAAEAIQAKRKNVIWIQEMLDKKSIIELYSHAAVFCCPSIYEPFGIINLEAMACETPVVGSAVGGIPEIIVHGETGFLVPLQQMKEAPFAPVATEQFARDLAAPINTLMADAALREKFGRAGRRRAEEFFSWRSIARKTFDLYRTLSKQKSVEC